MKKKQFEELTAALSIVICLAAYQLGIMWLFYIYAFKAAGDTLTAIYFAAKSVASKNLKKKTKQLKQQVK